MAVDKFAEYCAWFLSHCAKEPCMCKHWSTDMVRDCCRGIPFDMAKPKCTGFEPAAMDRIAGKDERYD